MDRKNLLRAIEIAGGTVKLAQKLGITSQAVSQWHRAPINRAIDIEKATSGKVTKEELRPDIWGEKACA